VNGGSFFGNVNEVTYKYGVTAVDMGIDGAVTIGNYSSGPEGYRADWRDHLFVHEYGHYIQSQQWGQFYLPAIGIPSIQSATIQGYKSTAPRHHDRWFEADASYKGMKYFDKHYGSGRDGYVQGSADYFDRASFYSARPSPYINPQDGRRNERIYQTRSYFHWTDISIYSSFLGLLYI
jgi:hypothetical protein